jgi:hypothetical protein
MPVNPNEKNKPVEEQDAYKRKPQPEPAEQNEEEDEADDE